MAVLFYSNGRLLPLYASFCKGFSRCYAKKSVTRVVLHKEVIRKSRHVDQPAVADTVDKDLPDLCHANPYEKQQPKCVICQHNVPLDYKNVRLLSQFVSSHTGEIYDRQVTGMCVFMHNRITEFINKARHAGLMAYHYKDPAFIKDPKLFDPFRRKW